jgi:hypothetical protein
MFLKSYRAINSSICSVQIEFTAFPSLQPEDQATVIQRVVKYYRGLSPWFFDIASWSVWPAKWRLLITVFLQALETLSAITPPPSSEAPIVETAAADTTTDPTNSDPSFKAGKDL